MASPCASGFWMWVVMVLTATTATVTGQGTCPIAGYASFNGVCYKDFPDPKTYDEAKQTCAADGGLLAMPKNSAANTYIHNLGGAGVRWIGLTDTDREGRWVFADGQTLASSGYTNWNSGEPNDAGRIEDCAELYGSTHGWNDAQCSLAKGFICQLVFTANPQWVDVFSTVKGTGQTVYDAWRTNGQVSHNKCPVVDQWESLNIQRVKVVLESSEGNRELIFDGRNTDRFNWFSKSRLLSSPWNDISAEPQNVFSIEGSQHVKRSFHINRNWGGCPQDAGWLAVADIGPRGICEWERAPEDQLPYIRFSKTTGYANYNGGDIATADRMVIYIDTPGKNVLCSCPAGQSLSEDGTRCEGCPKAGYSSLNRVCYKDFPDPKTYDEAKQTCAADGGLLAMPKNSAANTYIHNLGGAGVRWIGLTDTDREGRWVFADGQTLASSGYTNWNSGEPNDAGRIEDCAELYGSTHGWNDAQCSLAKGFICQLECAEEKAICSAWGDPHFTTFDGNTHHFQGPCRYTFAKDCGNSSDFDVEVQQVPSTWNPTVSYVRSVYVTAYGYEIGILQGKVVTVTGPPPTPPFTATPPFSLATGRIEVTLSGMYVRVELTELCVVILYDGVERVEVKIPSSYQNMMCGLCGNYNGIRNDDFELPNGNIVSNVNEFGNGWETGSNACSGDRPTGEPPTEGPCDPNYTDPCNVLTDTNGPFAACHGVVDPQIYLNSCVFDQCATQGQGGFLCANLKAYYATCRGAGVSPFDWRTPDLCHSRCSIKTTDTTYRYRWDVPQLTGTRFTFEVSVNNDAHIGLSPVNNDVADMYEIVIGGWTNTRSAIRRIPQGPDLTNVPTPAINSPTEFRTFWINWASDGTISVRKGGVAEPFMSWRDPNPLRVSYAGYSTGWGSTGRWKFCSTEGISGLTIDDAGIGHLIVSWTVVGNLPVSRYRLRYQPADGSVSYQDLSPAPEVGATLATVQGLQPDTEYTFTLTSFDEDDQPNGEINGTYTTDSVVVNVQCDQDSMSLSIPRAALLAVNVEDLHLLDPDCGATEDEDVFKLETHLQECGTRQETSGDDKFIFSNEVIANQVTHDNGAVRGQPVNLPFHCEFLRQRVVSGRAIMYNIPPPRLRIVDANNSFTIEMHMYTSEDFVATYESSDFPVQVVPSDRLHFGLSVASPLDNLELFARDCVSTPTTNPDDTPSVNIIDDGCQVDQTLQKDDDLSNDKALYYSVDAFTFPNALNPSLVYFHCTMIICFKDDPDSRCKQGCIPPARRRRAVSDGTEGRVRRESSRDHEAKITQGPFKVQSGEGAGPAGVPLGTAVGAAVGVAGIMVLLIVAVVLAKKRGGLTLRRKKRDDDTVGLDNYAYQAWGKMNKTGIADTKA
ncbi:PREDICTED: uncharacterized protein LOC109476932 [Branchiostoma belcheri]|uniref:Uncharacterized protein LOC109476932 n=1 Tax=Branchiostoma belcheri TaxID=7741 RepID=A0A6P4ZA12_BRABE|nr:PREDICTED: uncharacterized protein LOC109476932 [Branchiostoma belcheri]